VSVEAARVAGEAVEVLRWVGGRIVRVWRLSEQGIDALARLDSDARRQL